MQSGNLKNVESHFAFGKNWASYSALISKAHVDAAKIGLIKLIPQDELKGRSFLDIGCGAGVPSLAAAELGVSRIMAVDIDPDCVATARTILSQQCRDVPWQVEQVSIFELDPKRHGTFDIVYSWGVLHHTGSMWEAVNKAAEMVNPEGLLVIALYRSTALDTIWRLEKRMYSRSPKSIQRLIRACYLGAFRLGLFATKRSFKEYQENYKTKRGADLHHDVHDWLGGYPYETALAPEVKSRLSALGFKAERVFARPRSIGIFGSGCDEYVYRAPEPVSA
jgi:2-polyprenyl-6-hydroxyphenyl methylase/3-demethylubiquinone-9 3-methyltransferase